MPQLITDALAQGVNTLLPVETSLHAVWIETKLGTMLALANHASLILLEFIDAKNLLPELSTLKFHQIEWSVTGVLQSITDELSLYFANKLTHFETPISYKGTPFQQRVWAALQTIPYGQTRSYLALAQQLAPPLAVRAIGRANALNRLAIIIPCHRVINANGKLGGYDGGLERKAKLLKLEAAS